MDASIDTAIRVKWLPLFDLTHMRHPQNPKDHDLGAIIESINRFGFVAPVLLSADGVIVAGHGRVEALGVLKAQWEQTGAVNIPARLRVRGNDWLVPCVIGLEFANEDEATAYLIADNRISEIGGWVDADLLEVLKLLDAGPGIAGTGYDQEDMQRLVEFLDGTPAQPDQPADSAPTAKPDKEPRAGGLITITIATDQAHYEDMRDAFDEWAEWANVAITIDTPEGMEL